MKTFKSALKLSTGLFLIGTLLLGLFAINLSSNLMIVGYGFVVLAFIIGSGYCISFIFKLLNKGISIAEGLLSIGVLLLNIPIAIAYLYVVAMLMSYARITFENEAGAPIKEVVISGCERHELAGLGEGESKLLWITVPTDCDLKIEYTINGRRQQETVAGYLTNPCGLITTYRIGKSRDIMLDL